MTTTTSRVLMSRSGELEGTMLRKWCNHAAENGKSFTIEQKWINGTWFTYYTIEWPGEVMIGKTEGDA